MDRDALARKQFWFWIGIFTLLGAVLRFWTIAEQVPLDDEWHALNFVIGKSFSEVLLKQGMGANSIPVNIYSWLLLQTVGWSELALRLPSLIAGSAAVLAIPLLTRRIWGSRVAVVAAALLAVAPTLIFYSRVARPYGPIMLFGPVAVLLALIWVREGRRRDLLLAAFIGSVAIYYHLYALIPVGGTLGMCGVLALWCREKKLLPSPTPLLDLSLAVVILAVIDGLLVVLPNLLNPWWSKGIHNKDHATLKTATDLLELLAGTPTFPCMLLALLLALIGAFIVLRQTPAIGVPLLAPVVVFAIVAALTSQEGSQAAIQVARYGVTFIPLLLLLVAVAAVRLTAGLLESGSVGRRRAGWAVLMLAWTPFLLTSPLWRTYQSPNNFTNQSAYQYHYTVHDWSTSPRRDLFADSYMHQSEIPVWYMSPEMAKFAGVVEYPMLLGDHFNFYYYYQHFHRRPVRVGYLPNQQLGWRNDAFVFGNWTVDHVLRGLSPEQLAGMNWGAMVDIANIAALRQNHAGWLVLVHSDLLGEALPGNNEPHLTAELVAGIMRQAFGPPVVMDRGVSGWIIR